MSIFLLDIDECQMNNGGCQDGCTNTVGSFVCDCDRTVGFEIGSNGLNCVGKYISHFVLHERTLSVSKIDLHSVSMFCKGMLVALGCKMNM